MRGETGVTAVFLKAILVVASIAIPLSAVTPVAPIVAANEAPATQAITITLPNGTSMTASSADTDRSANPAYMPGRIIFKLASPEQVGMLAAPSAETLQRLRQAHGLSNAKLVFQHPRGTASLKRIHRATVQPGITAAEACRRLRTDPAVEWAEPDYIYTTCSTLPNDPAFPQQWHLRNTGQTGGKSGADIHAPDAWGVNTGGPSVIIAIVDTGVLYDHPDLADNIWINPGESGGGKETDGVDNDGNGYVDDVRGWDFVSIAASEVGTGEDPGPPDNDPRDALGHGTHCAGIAAAAGDNALGVAGVAWHCRIMPVRAGFKNSGGQGVLLSSDAAAAIVYAADNGASVISMSWGGGDSSAIRDALDYARSKDVCLVAAAGNGYSFVPSYPAAYPDVLAVAASDSNDTKAAFSNYGYWVDLIAPGVSIYSTWVDGGYASLSGTSMACPVTAGIAALVRSRFPARNADAVATTIVSSTDTLGFGAYVGTGRANAFKALQLNEVCTAVISSPQPGAMVEGTINVLGSAGGPQFAHYTLAYSTSISPPSFTPFSSSATAKTDAVLGALDASAIPDGPLLFRLEVTSLGGDVSVCQSLVELSRTAIFNAGGDIVSSPKPVKLAGSAEYGIAFGTSLGKVYLLDARGKVMPGWPVSTGSVVGYTAPAVADLDGDGVEDIVVHADHTLEAYAQNGSPLPGWPRPLDSWISGNSSCGAPVIYDIDGDKRPEVLVGHVYSVLAFHHDGTTVAGWPFSQPHPFGPLFSTPAVADLDGDGKAEICVKIYGGNGQPADVYLLHSNGTSVAGWPKLDMDRSHLSSPVLADIDGDGHLDVLVSLHYYDSGNYVRVYAWKLDGSPVAGFPVSGSWNTVPENNAVGDIDGDGFLEISSSERTIRPRRTTRCMRGTTTARCWPANGRVARTGA